MGPKARKLTLPLNGLNPQDHSVPLSLSMVSVPPLAGVDVVADGLPHAPTSTASADSMPMIAYRRRLIPNPPRLAISLSSPRRLVNLASWYPRKYTLPRRFQGDRHRSLEDRVVAERRHGDARLERHQLAQLTLDGFQQ